MITAKINGIPHIVAEEQDAISAMEEYCQDMKNIAEYWKAKHDATANGLLEEITELRSKMP